MIFSSDTRVENQLFKNNSTKQFISVGVVVSAIVFAVLGFMPTVNAVLIIPFACMVLFLHRARRENKLALTAILIPTILLGFFIAIYRPAGFEYPLVWHTDGMYSGGKEFNLTANLSKVIGGYLLIIWFAKSLAYSPSKPGSTSLRRNVLTVAFSIASILLVANVFFGVYWQPKFSEGVFYFVLINLFFTVISEEAFFRLLIHNHVAAYFKNRIIGESTGITIATLLFALSHSSAYGPAFLLYLFAGFVYAFAYSKTRSLAACIAVHFGVNIVHFIFLEYPM